MSGVWALHVSAQPACQTKRFYEEGPVTTRHLRLAVYSARAERRGAYVDPWGTISGWLWVAYGAAVLLVAASVWL